MNHIVNPKYRWLNSVLVAACVLMVLAQFFFALLGTGVPFHLMVAGMYAYLAYFVFRVTPWAYLAVAIVHFVALIGILKNLAELGIYGFVEMFFSIAIIWWAIFLRSNLMVPVRPTETEPK